MSKQEIDWSKAPEGATHWLAESETDFPGWLRENGDGSWDFMREWSRRWTSADPDDDMRSTMSARPTTWDGTGLPPAGIECDYKPRDSLDDAYDAPKRVMVFGTDGDYAAIRGDGFRCWVPVDHLLPLRAPQQIAAEEREKAVDELCAAIVGHYEAPKLSEHYIGLARALYDAGYRKVKAAE